MSFTKDDLEDLDAFLMRATQIVPYIDVARGVAPAGSIALRHDVDHSIEKALLFAEWEAKRGYCSTYYVLHSADYYQHDRANTYACCKQIILMGHELGFHNDALCAVGGDVVEAAGLIIEERQRLQEAMLPTHYSVLGIADHGGSPFTNGDIWNTYTPESLGFEYEAYQLQKTANTYISDNQGTWRSPLKHAQTFMLVHPTWWPV
jgi:hypothetical protein